MQNELYEECARPIDEVRREKLCAFLKVLSFILLGLSLLVLILFFQIAPSILEGSLQEEEPLLWNLYFISGIGLTALLFAGAVVLFFLHNRPNLSYDYALVSGELRISRVFNSAQRKSVCEFSAEEVLKLGKVGSDAYLRLKADRTVREIRYTPNKEPIEDKEFFYFYLSPSYGKRLYVLECREQLVAQMLPFAKRNVLEENYK